MECWVLFDSIILPCIVEPARIKRSLHWCVGLRACANYTGLEKIKINTMRNKSLLPKLVQSSFEQSWAKTVLSAKFHCRCLPQTF